MNARSLALFLAIACVAIASRPASADMKTFRFRATITDSSNPGDLGQTMEGSVTWDTSSANLSTSAGVGHYEFRGPNHAGIYGDNVRTSIYDSHVDIDVQDSPPGQADSISIVSTNTDDPTLYYFRMDLSDPTGQALSTASLPSTWPAGMAGTVTWEGFDAGPYFDVFTIDPASVQQVQNTIYVGDRPRSVAYNPLTKRAYVACEADGNIYSVNTDPASGNFRHTIQIPIGQWASQVVVDTRRNKILALTTNNPVVGADPNAPSVMDTLTVIDGATDTVESTTSLAELNGYAFGMTMDLDRGLVYLLQDSNPILALRTADLTIDPLRTRLDFRWGAWSGDGVVDPLTGNLIYNGGNFGGIIWDGVTNYPKNLYIGDNLLGLTVNNSGRRLYVLKGDSFAEYLIDNWNLTLAGVTPVQPDNIINLAEQGASTAATATDVLYVATFAGHVVKLEGEPKTETNRYVCGLAPRSIAVTSAGIFTANWGDDTLTLISTASAQTGANVNVAATPTLAVAIPSLSTSDGQPATVSVEQISGTPPIISGFQVPTATPEYPTYIDIGIVAGTASQTVTPTFPVRVTVAYDPSKFPYDPASGTWANGKPAFLHAETRDGVASYYPIRANPSATDFTPAEPDPALNTITGYVYSFSPFLVARRVPDTTPPVITVPSDIAATATSASGALISFSATAVDNADGLVTVTSSPLSGSIFPLGSTTVTCSASDHAGNSASASFNVTVTYAWSGVLAPINSDGSSVFKAGSTVPVKFQLTGASAGITNAVANLTFQQTGTTSSPVNEAVSTSAADSGNQFRYDATGKQYIFNMTTKGLTSGAKYTLFIDLHDGVQRKVTVGIR